MTPEQFTAGLVARGMAPHVAQAFALNGQDESGLDPGINERNPIVAGSRGGFGLMQWTGPRRKALEGFAAQRGASVADPDVQMDFLMHELQGPEAAAARSIMGARDASSAAVAIARDFLRPAKSNLDRRVAKYAGGNALAGPAAPAGNALAPSQQPEPKAPERPAFVTPKLDASDFTAPANAFAAMPITMPRNVLSRGA